MPPKLSDIAQKAKVCTATVSMILNRKEGFSYSEETVNRVMKVADELGYRPNIAARLMRSKETRLIGIAVQPDNSFYSYKIINMCSKWISKFGYEPILVNLLDPENNQNAGLFNHIDFLQGIICNYPNQEEKAVAACKKHNMKLPIVSLFRNPGKREFVREVYSNHEGAFHKGVSYLHSLNHRNIAYAALDFEAGYTNYKLNGFINESERLGINYSIFEEDYREDLSVFDFGEIIANKIIAGSENITAVFCANDEIALGVMSTLMRSGIKVPEDISILGYDDMPVAAHAYPRLTTFHQKMEDVAEEAVKLLIACIGGNETQKGFFPESIEFIPELVERDSVMRRGMIPLT